MAYSFPIAGRTQTHSEKKGRQTNGGIFGGRKSAKSGGSNLKDEEGNG